MTSTAPSATFDLLAQVAGDPEIRAIFSERSTVDAWLRTEIALASAQAQLGIIPRSVHDALVAVADPARIDMDQLWVETRVVGYPILPLVRQIDELLPEEERGSIHLGATTQDIMDTGLVLQLVAATDRLMALLEEAGDEFARLAAEHADSVMPGRTHAMHAVPTTFGAKLAGYLSDLTRHRERARDVRRQVATISLHGAGGTSAAYGPQSREIRALTAEALGLQTADVPWHVSRTRLAEWAQVWVLAIATAARFAREVIDLSRNEIAEVAEVDGHHRGASSTMPQKRNPITSEAIVGCSIIAAALSASISRVMEPGHERAAGEWHAEWYLLPHLASLAAGALSELGSLVRGLQVNPEQMRANLSHDHGLIMAEAYMIELAGPLGRENAHDVVYEAARLSRSAGAPLREALEKVLPEERLQDLHAIDPATYIGECVQVVETAVAAWKAGKGAEG